MLLGVIRKISVNGILVLTFSLAFDQNSSKLSWAICGTLSTIQRFEMSGRIALYNATYCLVCFTR